MTRLIPHVALLLFCLFFTFQASSSSDLQNLINFKTSLPNPTLLQNWVPNQNPCLFTGVNCQENRVSSIDLSYISLSIDFKPVSSFLLSLEYLESLVLSSTNISGSINESNCGSRLNTIDLSINTLSGLLSTISNLGSCQSLKFLNLSRNSIEFSNGFSFKKLEVLDLGFNKISGRNVVASILHNGCSEMKYLSLKGNGINGQDDADVSGCTNLRFLDLSANNFTVGVPSLGGCSSLEHLDISSNRFSGDISREISSCKNLMYLNISSNLFSGPVPEFPANKNLKFVSLSYNMFSGELPMFPPESCFNLVSLDVSSNNLVGSVPSSLGSCSLLQSLDISSNNFSGEFPINVLSKLSNLRELALSFNKFSGGLPDSLSDFVDLETLDLSSNNLSGKIPINLCQNPRPSLKQLFLQNNQFTGPIPSTLSNCTQLVSLHLGLNYLTGTIPASFGSLLKLRDLRLWLNQLEGEIPQELMYIQTLETLILDFNELSGSIPSGLSNCTSLNWISLSNNRFTGEIPGWFGLFPNLAILKLSNNSFHGPVPAELGDCRSLIWLDLNTNFLSGPVPPALFKQSGTIAVNFIAGKRYVYIKNDGSAQCHGAGNLLEFQGIRSEQLNRISTRNPCTFTRVYGGHTQPTFNNNGSMMFLDISYNMLTGTIPKEIGTMPYLFILNLGHNNISGPIPHEIGDLKGLNILDLSSNRLEGTIPQSMTTLTMLMEIDLSNNYLTGAIPEMGQLETFPPSKFANNSGLCGYPLPRCDVDSESKVNPRNKSHSRQASLAASIAMGLLFALFCIFCLIIVAVETNKRRKKKNSASLDVYMDNNSHSGMVQTSWKLTGAREALSINLATFDKPLKKLTFADLLEATNGFHDDSIIGSGGFGDVYKAELKDGSVVAIKKLIQISGQGDKEFTAEMETIGKIKHRNLVPLLGYCKVGEERLLVYEYMKYGSLDDVLHDQKKDCLKLNWAARRKIAIGAARGLAFLHHNCIPHIIHRDMKSSNVLVDENLDARVSDFGMARLMSAMDTHLSVSTLAGTPGYVPPEYYQSFRVSTKGDVYSYGVVLLELLTGRKPTDSADFGDNNIVGWVKQHAKMRISDVFDPVLMKEDPGLEIELLEHLRVATACLDDRPMRRPTMIQVMTMFKGIQAGSGCNSQSTIAADDAIESIEMSIKEVPE